MTATASAPVTADTTAAPATAPAVPVTTPAQPSRGTGHAPDATRTDQGDPILQAVSTPRGGEPSVTVPTPPAAPTAGPAPTAGAPAPSAPLAQQLARPVFALAHADTGEHVVTVQVVPDTLGPVTVRAHVTAHGMHVELFAASEAGRDAVRQVLPDLRRDAAGAGVATTLDLSSQNHPGAQPGRDDRSAPSPLRSDPGLEDRI
ncbi:flagellar hook-length control protein FliK, partial [Curtobacterium sp. Csp2]